LKIASKAQDSLVYNILHENLRHWLGYPSRCKTKNAFRSILALALLAGCQMDSDVDIATIDGITVFAVNVNGNAPVCVNDISVDEKNGDKHDRKWILIQNDADSAAGKSDCDNIFIFGKIHEGYQQTYDGKPLEVGKSYYVSYSGPGFGKGKTFAIAK
jgi:hypothetical protein